MKTSALCTLLGVIGSMPALAQETAPGNAPRGYSTDIELFRMNVGHRGITGMQTPGHNVPATFRYSGLVQYARNPLTLYDFDQEVGSVIRHRTSMSLAASVDISRRVSADIIVPMAYNSGYFDPAIAGEGFGLGDVYAGVRATAIRWRMLHFGVHGALILPSGARNMYIGEQYVRGRAGMMAMLDLGPLTVASDFAITARGSVDTETDFILGPEMEWNNGVRVAVPGTNVAFTSTLVTRGGFTNFLQARSAENSIELLGGVQYRPLKWMRLELGAGRGLSQGYGTSDYRVVGGLMFDQVPWTPPPPPPPPPPVRVETVLVEEIPEPDPPEPEWEEGEVAKIVGEDIKIRDKLQFKVNTAVLLPESIPTVEAVAQIINDNPLIGHMVIEGHASEEGSFEFNYQLSRRRSQAIWEELIRAGVHPHRMSYRGMGEVVPLKQHLGFGDTPEEILAVNRRVEFHIVRQYLPEEVPTLGTKVQQPWSGAEQAVVAPVAPLPVPEKTDEDDDLPPNFFDDDDTDVEMDDDDTGTPQEGDDNE